MNGFHRNKIMVFVIAIIMIAAFVLQNVSVVQAATNKKVKKMI